jgi:hypothetical protein
MRARGEKPDENRLRITQQYRERGGMAYDFGLKLRLRVFPREHTEDPGEWRLEARTSDVAGSSVITGWGSTRAEALSEAIRSWTAEAPALGLPVFDWKIVTDALTAVRAV